MEEVHREHIAGIEVRFYGEVTSTQDVVRALAGRPGGGEALAVVARHQTCGRGRGVHRWLSSPGDDLLLSLLWRPPALPAAAQALLPLTTTLAVLRTLHRHHPTLRIKWPNDILAGGRKLAGLLIENTLRGDRLAHTLVGVGINLNETAFPAELPAAVSLRMLTGRTYDPAVLLEELLPVLLQELQRSRPENFPAIKEEYEAWLYLIGEEAPFEGPGGRFSARLAGIDAWGRLLLHHADGRRRAWSLDEITLMR